MSDVLKIAGKLTKVLPTEVREGKEGKKYTTTVFTVFIDGKFPKTVAITDRGFAHIDQHTVDSEVEVCFDVSSREYNGKYYTDLTAYKITTLSPAPQRPVAPPVESVNSTTEQKQVADVDPDSLPF